MSLPEGSCSISNANASWICMGQGALDRASTHDVLGVNCTTHSPPLADSWTVKQVLDARLGKNLSSIQHSGTKEIMIFDDIDFRVKTISPEKLGGTDYPWKILPVTRDTSESSAGNLMKIMPPDFLFEDKPLVDMCATLDHMNTQNNGTAVRIQKCLGDSVESTYQEWLFNCSTNI